MLLLATVACATTAPRPGERPVPVPRDADIVQSSSRGPWTFRYASGARTYHVTRNAILEARDSIPRRETLRNFTHETLILEPAETQLNVRARIDSFTVEGSMSPAGVPVLPIQITGYLDSTSLILSRGDSAACSPVESVLNADLQNLLIRFPAQLLPGTTWRDSVEIAGCQLTIPTIARVRRSYTIQGEIIIEGQPVVVIARSDSVEAAGEGAQGQHRVLLEGKGTGQASYYLDIASGDVIKLSTTQTLLINITTSGRAHPISQTTTQEFLLAR